MHRAMVWLVMVAMGYVPLPVAAGIKILPLTQVSNPTSATGWVECAICSIWALQLPGVTEHAFSVLRFKISDLQYQNRGESGEIEKINQRLRDLESIGTMWAQLQQPTYDTDAQVDPALIGVARNPKDPVGSVVVGDGDGTTETVTTLSVKPGAWVQGATTSLSEEDAYDTAFDLLKQDRYLDSTHAFVIFLRSYPRSVWADDAWYWLGESRFRVRAFDDAMTAMTTVLEYFPQSSWIPSARLRVGYIHYELGDNAKARQALDGLVHDFPGHPVSELARDHLGKMDREGS